MMSPAPWLSVDSEACLRRQAAVMTIEAATTLWPCGGLYLE